MAHKAHRRLEAPRPRRQSYVQSLQCHAVYVQQSEYVPLSHVRIKPNYFNKLTRKSNDLPCRVLA